MSAGFAYFRCGSSTSTIFTDGPVRVLRPLPGDRRAYRVVYVSPTDNQRGAGEFTAYVEELDFDHASVQNHIMAPTAKEDNVNDQLDEQPTKKPKYKIPPISRMKYPKERRQDVQAILLAADSDHDAAELIEAYYAQALKG